MDRDRPRRPARDLLALPVHVDALEEWGVTSEFIATGGQILSALKKAQKTQAVKNQDLPTRTRNFYQAKVEMCLSIKRAQRCARATFKREPAKAARYSLEILYRRTRAPSGQKKAALATTTTAQAVPHPHTRDAAGRHPRGVVMSDGLHLATDEPNLPSGGWLRATWVSQMPPGGWLRASGPWLRAALGWLRAVPRRLRRGGVGLRAAQQVGYANPLAATRDERLASAARPFAAPAGGFAGRGLRLRELVMLDAGG